MGMKVNGTSGLTFPDTTTLASAGQASVRAWVNFNGIGTVAIRASYNVTSITDVGTGQYNVNYTTALPDTNYCVQVTSCYGSTESGGYSDPTYINGLGTVRREDGNTATTQCKIITGYDFGAYGQDHAQIFVAIFR